MRVIALHGVAAARPTHTVSPGGAGSAPPSRCNSCPTVSSLPGTCFALVTIAPAIWLVVCTMTAGLEKVFHPGPNVGFISHAFKYADAIAAGQMLAPAKSVAEMTRIMVNDYIEATLAALFVLVVAATVIYAVINIWKALASPQATAVEIGLAGAVPGGRHA
jgi:carbon starvation protein CstA